MVIQHNLAAMNTNRMAGIVTNRKAKVAEKLGSGFKVNRAADDSAGLAISEKMRRQIRGLTQASSNAKDGISMVQTAEGGLNEVHEMIQRLNELAVKASNGTLDSKDREYADAEFQQLKREINRVANSTTFNEIQLFPSDGSSITTFSVEFTRVSDGTYVASEGEIVANSIVGSSSNSEVTGSEADPVTIVGDAATNATGNATALFNDVKTLIPTILTNISSALPSLGAPDNIKLDLSYIDGSNGTLAYASYSYYVPGYEAASDSFLVKIDTADFTDSNALSGGSRRDMLESTLYHELTHTLMQNTMSRAMATELPTWFKEGAAQMSGGGFTAGWNNQLIGIMQSTTMDEAAKKAAIRSYLRSREVTSDPYGHGFLATAYISELAGGGTVNPPISEIYERNGLNTILTKIKEGKTLEEAVSAAIPGKTLSQLLNDINSGTDDGVNFVYNMVDAAHPLAGGTEYGAGSPIRGWGAGSTVLGDLPTDPSTASELSAANALDLQVGAEKGQTIEVKLFSIGTQSLGISTANILTQEEAQNAISSVKNSLGVISSIRSYYGSIQNRLEHTIKNLDNVVENTTAAESQIRDTDMAKTMVEYANLNILDQAGISMLTQANQTNQSVLSLLR